VGSTFNQELLADNLRCKIIYYSCITPNTVSDLNKAWGYSSPTYLYQEQSLEQLKQADMIEVEKDGSKNLIRSNYDLLFGKETREDSREHINREILREFLVHSKGFHPHPRDQVEVENLVQMGRQNLEDELKQELERLEFGPQEFQTLTQLWRTEPFKQIFLSLEITSKLVGDDRDSLPSNPLTYLFRMTAGLMSSVSRAHSDGKNAEIPPDLQYRAEKIIVPAYRMLDDLEQDQRYDEFTMAMEDTFSLFRTKFKEERFNYDFIEDFIDLTIRDQSEKRKFGKLFSKYRD